MTTDTDTFTFSRSFPLGPDRMWQLMTDATMREAWSVPDDSMTLKTVTSDLSVGGVDHHRCGPAEAPEFEVETRWYNLEGPNTATCTETIIAGGARLGASLVTYLISPDGKGSKVDITVAVSSFVGAEMIEEFRAGWEGGVENLAKMAATQSS